jgi:hypothetical protein
MDENVQRAAHSIQHPRISLVSYLEPLKAEAVSTRASGASAPGDRLERMTKSRSHVMCTTLMARLAALASRAEIALAATQDGRESPQ